MKNITKTLLLTIVSFLFVGMVNAAEAPLNSVGVIASDVGGSNKSIIETDTANQGKYTYYYTIRQIGDTDFNTYVKQKYIYDNAQEGTTEKVNAANQISNLETKMNKNCYKEYKYEFSYIK